MSQNADQSKYAASALFSLQAKTALVTGGATGIGRMAATGLAMAGATVLIASRKGEDCVATAQQINEILPPEAGNVIGFAGDVGNEEGIDRLVMDVNEKTETLDILINNAGVTWGAPIDEFPYGAWAKIMDVNVAGLFTLTQRLLPMLRESAKQGDPARVINLGSVMGSAAIGDGAYSYSASKAAVHHLTRILAKELAHEQITVNAVAPGPFQSKMTAFATSSEEQAKKVGRGVPLGRIGAPDDVAGTMVFLSSAAGAYVTGAIIPLDGGIHTLSSTGLFSGE